MCLQIQSKNTMKNVKEDTEPQFRYLLNPKPQFVILQREGFDDQVVFVFIFLHIQMSIERIIEKAHDM